MNNKPVAWINKVTFQHLTELGYSAKVYQKRSDGDIPLYTQSVKEQDCYGDGNVYRGVRSKDSEVQTIYFNPVKELTELTDEEILYFFKSSFCKEDFIDDIRAILRKASEKCNHSNFVKTEHLTGEGAMEYVEWFDNTCSDCGKHWTTNN